jgi:hypothetical protein
VNHLDFSLWRGERRSLRKLLPYPSLMGLFYRDESFNSIGLYLAVDEQVVLAAQQQQVPVAVTVTPGDRLIGARAVFLAMPNDVRHFSQHGDGIVRRRIDHQKFRALRKCASTACLRPDKPAHRFSDRHRFLSLLRGPNARLAPRAWNLRCSSRARFASSSL